MISSLFIASEGRLSQSASVTLDMGSLGRLYDGSGTPPASGSEDNYIIRFRRRRRGR